MMTLFEWGELRRVGQPAAPPHEKRESQCPTPVEAHLSGSFLFDGVRACALHLSTEPGPCSVDVRDRAGRQLQGFDGATFALALQDATNAGITFDVDRARRIGRLVRARQGIR